MTRKTTINILQLKETTYKKPTELYGIVEKCVICKKKHIHSAEEGHRSGHCIDKGSVSYKLVIDRENEENIKLAEKYGIALEEKGSEV